MSTATKDYPVTRSEAEWRSEHPGEAPGPGV